MDNLGAIVPLVVAIGGGLAFLAYRHPREYRPLAYLIFAAIVVTMIAGAAWNTGGSQVKLVVRESGVVHGDDINKLNTAMDAAASLPWWWPVVLPLGGGYVLFLAFLPNWIKDVEVRYRATDSGAKTDSQPE
jgi:hypothetical protein